LGPTTIRATAAMTISSVAPISGSMHALLAGDQQQLVIPNGAARADPGRRN
jgi:phage tail sheath gpL-like